MTVPIPKFLSMPILVEMPIPKKLPILVDADSDADYSAHPYNKQCACKAIETSLFLSPNACIFLLHLACVNTFVKGKLFLASKKRKCNTIIFGKIGKFVLYEEIGKYRLYFTDADSKKIADTCLF